MRHSLRFPQCVRFALAALTLVVLCAPAAAQDPLVEMRKILATRAPIDLLAPEEKQQEERKKFYAQREAELGKMIDTKLFSLADLRQALTLKDWGDVPKTGREDPEVIASDLRLRHKVAEKFRAKVRAVVEKGDDDSKAAVGNLLTELGLTVRAAIDPAKLDKLDLVKERRVGFSRSMTDEVIALTKSNSEFVRLHALRAVGGINADPKRAAAVLAAKLAAKDDVRGRRIAADGLVRLVSIQVYLKDRSGLDQAVSAEDLDVLNAAVEVARIAPTGLNDPDPVVRASCGQAVRVAADVVAVLVRRTQEEGKQALKLPTPRFTYADLAQYKELLKAFADAGPRLAHGLTDPEPEVRIPLVFALERLTDARARLREEKMTVGTKREIKEEILLLPNNASDPLAGFAKGEWKAVARMLADPEVRVRRGAVNFLEFFPEAYPAVVGDLTAGLGDSDRFVRWGAARALGRFTKAYQPKDAIGAVPALAKLLFDGDVTVRGTAADTLEAMGPYAEAAVPELVRAVHFGDADQQVATLYVIQSIGPERSKAAISSVTQALENPDAKVRRAAAETLGRYGSLARNKATVDALRRALGDDDQDVRINASEALVQILSPSKL